MFGVLVPVKQFDGVLLGGPTLLAAVNGATDEIEPAMWLDRVEYRSRGRRLRRRYLLDLEQEVDAAH